MSAFSRWTDAHLGAMLAGLRPMVRFDDGCVARVPIETFLEYLAAPERFSSSHGAMYLTDFSVLPDFGDARREVLAPDAAFPLDRGGACAEWISLYAGPAGTSTEFHQDIFSTHTWLALLRGEKIWHLCAPDADVSQPEVLTDSGTFEAVMTAGDLIYLPPDWWHQVLNRTPTLAISGNFCSFAHAEASLAQAQSSTSSRRDEWTRAWTEILARRTRDTS